MNSQSGRGGLGSQSVKAVISTLSESSTALGMTEYSQALLLCANTELDSHGIQKIDSVFSTYFKEVVQQLKECTAKSSSGLKVTGDLVNSLLEYLQILNADTNPSGALVLNQIIGCVQLSCHLIETVVSHVISLVTSQSHSHSTEHLKSTWDLVTEFILRYVNLLEKYISTDHSTILPSLCEVIICMAKIACDIADIDTKAMALLYKCVVRMLDKEVSYYRRERVIDRVMESVCQTTMHKLSSSTPQQGGAESKLKGFLLKIMAKLVSYIAETDSHLDWSGVVKVIVRSSDSLSNTMYGTPVPDVHLDQSLKSLLSSCLPSRNFSSEIIAQALKSESRKLSSLYAISLIQEGLARCPTVYRHWWIEPMLSQLVQFYTLCGNELCKPTLVKDTLVTTCYEFVLGRLSAMIATMPGEDDFILVEKMLLTLLLCPAVHLNILAIDCWHFVARYSPERLPYAHCCKLVDLLSDLRLSDQQVSSIQNLLYRLVSLIQPNAQQDLLRRSKVFDSGALARFPFSEHVRKDVDIRALESLKTHYDKLQNNKSISQPEIHHSMKALARLLSISYQTEEGERVSSNAAKLLTKILIDNIHNPSLEYPLCLFLNCLSSRRRHHPILLKLLHSMSKRISTSPVSVQQAAVTCVSKLLTLPTNQDQELAVSLFTSCISSRSGPLRLRALQSFKMFAKTTPYQELINQIASKSSDINDAIVQYCSKQMNESTLSGDLASLESWNLSGLLSSAKASISMETDECLATRDCEIGIGCEPREKRLRLDADSTIVRLREVVDSIRSAHFTDSQWREVSLLSTDIQNVANQKLSNH